MKPSRLALLLLAPLLLPLQLSFFRDVQPSPEQKISMYSKPGVVRVIAGCYGSYRDIRDGKMHSYLYNPGDRDEYKNKGFADFYGTGFFISSDGYIVTNAHLVELAAGSEERCQRILKENVIRDLKDKDPGLTREETEWLIESNQVDFLEEEFNFWNHVMLPNADPISVPKILLYEIKEMGSISNEGSKDVAIIKVAVKNAPILRFANPDELLQIQDPITVIGYPGLADPDRDYISGESVIEATITEGIVSNPNKTLQDDSPIIQVDVLTAEGSSGSPVLNADGEVIGMITFSGVERGAQIPFAIPTSTIQEFVRKSGALNQEGSTDHLYQDGLEFYWKGNYEGARTKFEAVTSLFPYHSEANRLLRESEQKIAEAWERKNFTFWLAGIGILVAVLAVVNWLVRRKPVSLAPEGASANLPDEDLEETEASEIEARPMNLPRLITNLFPSKTVVSSEPLLELKNTQGQIRRIYLQEERYKLGRDPAWSDIELPDEGWEVISRHHALFVKEGDDYRIFDGDGTQPSTNGTFINNQRVVPAGHSLRDGDQLTIGQDERNQVTLTYLHPTSRRVVSRQTQARE